VTDTTSTPTDPDDDPRWERFVARCQARIFSTPAITASV